MFALLAASLAPVLGPALYRAAGHRLTPLAFLDGLVYVALPGLVFLVVFPESAGVGNWTPLALLVLGAVGPSLAERLFHRFAEGTHRLAVFLGVSGLALHALLEGAALGPAVLGTEGGSPFVLAVVLHRLPVGLAVWWLLRPSYGPRVALGAIAALIACTLAGYGAGEELTTALSGRAAGLFQAFVAGTLLHVVFHKAPTPAQMSGIEGRPAPARAEGWGALAGLALLAAVAWPEMASGEHGGHAVAEFARRFAGLTLESAPALLLAYIAAGLLSEFMPASSIAWMARGGSLSSAARGMTVGLPFPVCSCGVVPLYRTLVTRGAPAAAAMAFLVATPELGFDAVFLSFPLLGGPMTLIRVGAAALTALLVGWIVGGWLARRGGDHRAVDEAPPAEAPTGPLGTRLARAAGAGFGDVVDHTAPWILLGLFVAAAAAPYLEGGWLGAIPSGLDVAVFALLGLPTYVCASSATPLVAALMAGGLSPGAALAFLITGPATNATTFGVLAQLHGRRAALVFSLTIIGLSVGLGLLVNGVWGHLTTPSLDALAEEPGSVVERISAALLAVVFAGSLLRRGARRFVGELRFETGLHAHA